jgi:hypothetical protein
MRHSKLYHIKKSEFRISNLIFLENKKNCEKTRTNSEQIGE